MRLQERNKTVMWRSRPSLGTIKDENGLDTFEHTEVWSEPVAFRAIFGETAKVNAGGTTGFYEPEPYGAQDLSNASIIMERTATDVLDEGDVVWLSKPDVTDGTPSMDDAYDVRRVAHALDYTVVSLSRREGA